MKNSGTVLCVVSIILGIAACEKSPEDIFDISAIPGQYEGYTEVYAPDSSGFMGWGEVRRIPVDYNAKDIYSIQKVNEKQYSLTFGSTDTILPDKITFEISSFEEQSYNQIDAYIKVVENDLWQLSFIFNFGMGNGIINQFRYDASESMPAISFIFVLKSKTRDDITLECYGHRYYD